MTDSDRSSTTRLPTKSRALPIHAELGILTANGLTPYEAIQTGTVHASAAIEAMTGSDDIGTIEVGKRADLLPVGGNPLEDVAHIDEQRRGVMAAGAW